MHCWHVKDWVKAGGSLPPGEDLEKELNDHEALLICGELANRGKHYKFTPLRRQNRSTRPQTNARMGGSKWKVRIGDPIKTTTEDYTITFPDGSVRLAIDVARQALADWQTVLKKYGLPCNN